MTLKKTNWPIKNMQIGGTGTYFENVIKPLLDHPLIEFIGEIGYPQKNVFLGNAAALLFPINWREPFGLVMIEAMACGKYNIFATHSKRSKQDAPLGKELERYSKNLMAET